MDALRSELDQVSSELGASRVQYASLGARIAGLEAQQQALVRALAHHGHAAGGAEIAVPRYRTDAIVAVLEASGTEMSIHDVIDGLANMGRPGETYDNVGADLAYLVERGRADRARRGVYMAAASSAADTTTNSGSALGTPRARPLLRREHGGKP
jgi:hypothetical protein